MCHSASVLNISGVYLTFRLQCWFRQGAIGACVEVLQGMSWTILAASVASMAGVARASVFANFNVGHTHMNIHCMNCFEDSGY